MIIKRTKKNKESVPYEAEGFRSGFALLFAVVISSIVLAIALGVLNIALKEVNFTTSGKEANDAFFAADTGAECALSYDYNLAVNIPFPEQIVCANVGTDVIPDDNGFGGTFSLSGLGDSGKSCVTVTIFKNQDPINPLTTITSQGYNVADASGPICLPVSKSVERQLEVTY